MLLMLVVVIIGDYRAVPGVTVVAGEDLLAASLRLVVLESPGSSWSSLETTDLTVTGTAILRLDYEEDSSCYQDLAITCFIAAVLFVSCG